jgi:photosystem II stability/assembly factor-like uncharacterized protein
MDTYICTLQQWEAIASSADGSHLVAGGQGTDIYTSTNGGQTWVDHGGTTNYNWIAAASSADGSRISLVNSSGTQPYSGVWTSTNGGSTWFDPVMASTPQAIASSADGTKMVMVVASGDIFTTNNSGQTWVDAGGSTYNSWWWDVASSSDGTHLVAVAQAGGDIWTSNT